VSSDIVASAGHIEVMHPFNIDSRYPEAIKQGTEAPVEARVECINGPDHEFVYTFGIGASVGISWNLPWPVGSGTVSWGTPLPFANIILDYASPIGENREGSTDLTIGIPIPPLFIVDLVIGANLGYILHGKDVVGNPYVDDPLATAEGQFALSERNIDRYEEEFRIAHPTGWSEDPDVNFGVTNIKHTNDVEFRIKGPIIGVGISWLSVYTTLPLTLWSASNTEYIPADKQLELSIRRFGLPDLVIQSITTSPTNPLFGEALNIEFIIKNIGSEDSSACTLAVHYGTETKEFIVPQLKKGDSYIIRDQLNALSETLTVRAKIDNNGEVDELDETNNEATKEIKVEDFEISVEPKYIEMIAGDNTSFTIKVMSKGNFSSEVLLSYELRENIYFDVAISPVKITPPPNGWEEARMTIVAHLDAPFGRYDVNVSGIFRSVRRNSTASISIMGPDLKPEILVGSIVPDQMTEINITVKNIGVITASNSETLVQIISDVSTSGVKFAVPPLEPGKKFTHTILFTPNSSAKFYNITVIADYDNRVKEQDEANNRDTYRIMPDLAITVLVIYDRNTGSVDKISTDHEAEIVVEVANVGNWFMEEAMVDVRILNRTTLYWTRDFKVQARGPRKTHRELFKWVPYQPGNYMLVAAISVSVDANLSNNEKQQDFFVHAPDLMWPVSEERGIIWPYADMTSDGKISITGTYFNRGDASVDKLYEIGWYLYDSSDTLLASGIFNGATPLAPNAFYTLKVNITYKFENNGTCYIKLYLDRGNNIHEWNETNNERVLPFYVTTHVLTLDANYRDYLITIDAEWESWKQTYRGNVLPISIAFPKGAKVKLFATPLIHVPRPTTWYYKFMGWTVNGILAIIPTNPIEIMMAEPIPVSAVYKETSTP
jgi:hypothetical protein